MTRITRKVFKKYSADPKFGSPERLNALSTLRTTFEQLIKDDVRIILVDEAVFTTSRHQDTGYSNLNQNIKFFTQNSDSRCVAAVGAIDLLEGKIHLTTTLKAAD